MCVYGTICWLTRGQSWQSKPAYTDAQKALFMAVCVGFEPTERYSRSRFSKPAHLPLCQHTSWQELKDLNPYKMIWNHLCYHYTKSLKMAGTARIELATHRLTVCRSNQLNYIPILFIILYMKSYVKHLKCDYRSHFQKSHSKYFRNTLGTSRIKLDLFVNDNVLTINTKFPKCF